MKQDYSPLSAMVAELQRCSKQHLTGLLSFVCEDNRSGRISLENGQVVAAQYQGKNGTEALELMASIDAMRCRFQEGPIPPARADMPTTDAVFQLLGGAKAEGTTAPTPAAAPSAPKAGGLSDAEKQTIQEVLADCIGPMATLLCEDHLEGATDLKAVIEALADELPGDQAGQFKAAIKARLG